MKFKSLRYNILVCFLVALMVLAVGFSSFKPNDDSGLGDNPEPGITQPDEPDNGEPARTDIPSIRQPKQLLAYSMNIFLNGRGYKSKVEERMKTYVPVPLIDAVSHHVIMQRQFSNNIYVEQTWSRETSSTGMGENFYEQVYADIENGTVEFMKCSRYSHQNQTVDLSSGTLKTMALAERFPYNDAGKFDFEMINSNYSSITGKTADSGTYYIVIVDYKKDMVPESWKAKYYNNDQIVNGSIRLTKDVRFTFYISVKTGKILQYTRGLEYLANIASPRLNNVRFVSEMGEVFEKMDESFIPERPVSTM